MYQESPSGGFRCNATDIAWSRALQHAGPDGRVATVPDVVEARLAAGPKHRIWNTYVSTTSIEYAGVSKMGNRILIVAHGRGPITTPTDLKSVLRQEPKEQRTYARVPRKEFLKLESGAYGQVEIVDFDPILPDGANAYMVGDVEIIWENGDPKYHEINVDFYAVDVDLGHRALTPDEIEKDPSLIQKFMD